MKLHLKHQENVGKIQGKVWKMFSMYILKEYCLSEKWKKKSQCVFSVLHSIQILGLFACWLHSGLFFRPCSHHVKFTVSLRAAVT